MNLLQKGDKIRIVAPARKVSLEEIQTAMQLLEISGYQVDLGKYTLGNFHQFSGMDNERASDLQNAIDDDSVKAIWCARGGYGGLRILDKIDFSKFEQNPKWICGYSDTTALHALINNVLYLPSLHCTVPINIQQKDDLRKPSFSTMLTAMETGKLSYEIPSHLLNREGRVEGKLIGGNLSILYAVNGSFSDIKTENAVLFIEDVDEYLYHIDRMMLCLKRAGKLANLAGLIVGGMSNMHDNAIPYGKTAEEIVYEHIAEYDYPVCFGFPAGHIQDNRALIMGGKISLDIDSKKVTIQNNI
jgi:muramoyltetrapeptide carboxypeptidase